MVLCFTFLLPNTHSLFPLYTVGKESQVTFCTLIGVMSLESALKASNFLDWTWWWFLWNKRSLFAASIVSSVLVHSMFIISKCTVFCIFHALCSFPLLLGHFRTVRCFVTQFSAVMTGGWTFRCLILDFGRWWKLESRMHVLTLRTIRAEAGQVVVTQHSPNVPMSTVRTVSAETPIVPGTIFYLTFRIDVQEGTLLVVARIEAGVEVTFGHLGHVVLVQEFTLVTLFA